VSLVIISMWYYYSSEATIIAYFIMIEGGLKSSSRTWQLKTMGVEALVFFRRATMRSKHSGVGAASW